MGHILYDPNEKHCECGRYGCLETVVSETAIAANTSRIKGKEDILDSWKGDNNLYIQLAPAFTAKFGDDFHCYEKTYREIPESVFISPGREEHSVFLPGPLPTPENVPEAVQRSYRLYLEQRGH